MQIKVMMATMAPGAGDPVNIGETPVQILGLMDVILGHHKDDKLTARLPTRIHVIMGMTDRHAPAHGGQSTALVLVPTLELRILLHYSGSDKGYQRYMWCSRHGQSYQRPSPTAQM